MKPSYHQDLFVGPFPTEDFFEVPKNTLLPAVFFANQFQQNVFGWILARCFFQMIFVKWATKKKKKNSYVPLYWSVNRDHYHGLL